MTPLSYSLPAFRPGDYDGVEARLGDLKDLGFSWVTFTPTWMVSEGRIVPSRIDLQPVVRIARAAGLRIQLDPHLDYESTLTGGPYVWRRDMRISPVGEYERLVLEPMLALEPDAITLGSELDVSLVLFAHDWLAVADRVRIMKGHKLNHDSLNRWSRPIRKAAGMNLWTYFWRFPTVMRYLRNLDYVSFSLYDKDFEGKARELSRKVRTFAVGEFGLGSTDLDRPWHFEGGRFDTPDAMALRQGYYLSFLDSMRRNPGVYGSHPATFWTVGQFDFLSGPYRDEALRAAVRDYNIRPEQLPNPILGEPSD